MTWGIPITYHKIRLNACSAEKFRKLYCLANFAEKPIFAQHHSSNSLYFPKAQTLPLFSLTTLYLCPTSTITPNPKTPPTSNISLTQPLLYPLPAMEITRNPLPLSALVEGFTCKTRTLSTLAFSSSPRRRIPIITHIPISFTLLRNQNFRVPSKWVS